MVLHLQAPVEDGFLLCRPAEQRKHLVKGKLRKTGEWKALWYLLTFNQIELTFCSFEAFIALKVKIVKQNLVCCGFTEQCELQPFKSDHIVGKQKSFGCDLKNSLLKMFCCVLTVSSTHCN